jgi:hypothetical protein
MPKAPEPIPATGDAYAGGYAFTVGGSPFRSALLSADQFAGAQPWESPGGMPVGSFTEAGSSL